MFKSHSFLSILFCCAAVAALGMSTASGQNYPSRPIRIVTAPAGSGADITTRVIARAITEALGQPIVVDNRPGGVIPGQLVSQAAPDGYTLLYSGSSFWNGVLLRKSTPYHPVRDFQPIIQTIRQPGLLVVPAALPVKSVKDLIALAKARPREINYATVTLGSLNLQRIDYKGGAQMATDLIAGHVQVMFGSMNLAYPHAKSGKLRALGVTTAQPTELMPGLPTIAETLPGYESVSNAGIFAPAKTPRAIVDRLNQEIGRVLFRPEIKEKLVADGSEAIGGSRQQFESAIKAEMATIAKLIKDRGISVAE
jgi:tripartite-type tricarboxylate transporter receptor subunit TctC